MSISAISGSTGSYQASPQDETQQDFLALAKAIKSGDLSGAQQAYATLTQAQSANGTTPDLDSPAGKALAHTGQALQSGDIATAQQSLASLQSHGHRHGGHHHHSKTASDAATTTGAAAATTQTQAAAPPTSILLDITA